MYHLLSRIPEGINPMLDVLQKHVTDFGFDAIKGIPEAQQKANYPLLLASFVKTKSILSKSVIIFLVGPGEVCADSFRGLS